MSPAKRLLLDVAPLGLFFLGYRFGNMMLATALIIIATLVSLTITYVIERKIALSPLISGVLVTVFGGLTLWLNDEQFIKLKPTIVNVLLASVLLIGAYGFKRGLLRHVLGMAFELTDAGWRLLSIRWGFFFLFLACLNEIVWRNFSTDFWVNFKVFGMMSSTIIFTLCQLNLIKRYALPENSGSESSTGA